MRPIDAEPIERFIENGLNCKDPQKRFGHDAIEILTEVHYAPTIAPPPNAPLTLEELREMDGEPVWVADLLVPSCSCYYFRQNISGYRLLVEPKNYPSETLFVPHYNADDENGAYGTTWKAYRRRPEEAST